jgi:hypothetical protein
MWIASKLGFFSIVQKQPGEWHVRARVRGDLENLVNETWQRPLIILGEIQEWPAADYRWRLILRREGDMQRLFATLLTSVDYPNFKSEVGARPDQREKLPAYHDLWHGLMELQR